MKVPSRLGPQIQWVLEVAIAVSLVDKAISPSNTCVLTYD